MCVREVHKHAALILSRSRWKISAFEAIFRETRLRARGAGKAKSHCANTCGIIFFVRDTNSFILFLCDGYPKKSLHFYIHMCKWETIF